MAKRFDEFIQRKKENGVLYQRTVRGRDICGNCIYRRPWQNVCSKFKKNIQRVGQSNRGFHHLPCEECLNYKIQTQDLQYYINSYKKRFPNRIISECEGNNG